MPFVFLHFPTLISLFHQLFDLSPSLGLRKTLWFLPGSHYDTRLYIPRTLVLGQAAFPGHNIARLYSAVGGCSLLNSECARGVCSEESQITKDPKISAFQEIFRSSWNHLFFSR